MSAYTCALTYGCRVCVCLRACVCVHRAGYGSHVMVEWEGGKVRDIMTPSARMFVGRIRVPYARVC